MIRDGDRERNCRECRRLTCGLDAPNSRIRRRSALRVGPRQRRPDLERKRRRRSATPRLRKQLQPAAPYAQLLDADNVQARFDAVTQADQRDDGRGVAYRTRYCIRPDPAAPEPALWVEDTGRWFAGADGKPARAHGTVRVINERHERERRLLHLARYDELTGRTQPSSSDRRFWKKPSTTRCAFARSCGFLLVAIDNLARINESVRLRRRRAGDPRGRQTHSQPDARQGFARPLFRQQVRHRASRLHARRYGDRRRAAAVGRARGDGPDLRRSGGGDRLPSAA